MVFILEGEHYKNIYTVYTMPELLFLIILFFKKRNKKIIYLILNYNYSLRKTNSQTSPSKEKTMGLKANIFFQNMFNF